MGHVKRGSCEHGRLVIRELYNTKIIGYTPAWICGIAIALLCSQQNITRGKINFLKGEENSHW